MSKRSVFTSITPLPAGLSRESVFESLHDHLGIIDLQPQVIERHPCRPPPFASAEEAVSCQWYNITDKVSYLPGVKGSVSYHVAFHNLPNGMQSHVFAPLGVEFKDKWTLGGSLPGEPLQPQELGLGIPKTGLYIREDVDLRCNYFLTSFVKGNLKKAHEKMVERMIERAHLSDARHENTKLYRASVGGSSGGSPVPSPQFDQQQFPDHRQSTLQPNDWRSSSPMTSPRMSYQTMNSSGLASPPPIQSPQYVDPAYQQAYNKMQSGNAPYIPHQHLQTPVAELGGAGQMQAQDKWQQEQQRDQRTSPQPQQHQQYPTQFAPAELPS